MPPVKVDATAARRSEHVFRAGSVELRACLEMPTIAAGIVVIPHGGRGRSVRDARVAALLRDHGFATLMCDLLSADEAAQERRDPAIRLDVATLGRRLALVTGALVASTQAAGLPVGFYAAGLGSAAALTAAALHPAGLAAIVCRGGRLDLASPALASVHTPTLLLVGSRDLWLLDVNRRDAERIPAKHRVISIPGTAHLFDEPGALDEVAAIAATWFREHFDAARPVLHTEACVATSP